MLQEAAEGGEEALGLSSFPPRSTRHDPHPGSGVGQAVEARKTSPLEKGAGPAGRVPAGDDEDRDVRELESMLMGLEAEEELESVPVVRLDADTDLAAAAASANKAEVSGAHEAVWAGGVATPPEAAAQTQTTHPGSPLPVEGAATLVSHADPGPRSTGSHSPLAFTIEEDGDDNKVQASNLGSRHCCSPPGSPSTAVASAAAADVESTRELLGSIAATLSPSAPDGGTGETGSNPGGSLSATKSELALVDLMDGAEGEPGGLSAAAAGLLRDPGDNSESSRRQLERTHDTYGVKEEALSQPGRGDFDNAQPAGSTAFGSSDTAGMIDGSRGNRSGGGGAGGVRGGDGAPGSQRRDGFSSSGATLMSGDIGKASATTGAAIPGPTAPASAPASGDIMREVPGDNSTAKDKLGVSSSARASKILRADPVFSLGHDRWVTCGFTSAHTFGRGKPGEASVGRALRDASNVLALDNVNYFLAK